MFTYEKIGDCSKNNTSIASCQRSHIKINFENGSTVIICIITYLLPSVGSFDQDINSTKDHVANKIKQIETCYILDNIFNIKYINHVICDGFAPYVEFDDKYTVSYYNSTYEYWSQETKSNDGIFTNIHELLDFLREKYRHLLKPVKLAINDE